MKKDLFWKKKTIHNFHVFSLNAFWWLAYIIMKLEYVLN